MISLNSETFERVKNTLNTTTNLSVLGLFFSLPFSRSLFLTSALILVFSFLFGGKITHKLRAIFEEKSAYFILILFFWIVLSSVWTIAQNEAIDYALNIHWKLILIPILFVYFRELEPLYYERCWNAFGVGCVILLIAVYLSIFHIAPFDGDVRADSVFFNAIPQSVVLSIFAAWCIFKAYGALVPSYQRWGALALFFLSSYPILFVSQQRLGYLAWALGTLGSVFLLSSNRSRFFWAGIISVFVGFIFYFNDVIFTRLTQAVLEFKQFNFTNDYSSVGARLQMWNVSIQAIQQAPLFGHGVGSYGQISKSLFSDDVMCQVGCGHPHNQFLFYWVEFGLVGLALFVGTLYLSLVVILRNISENKFLLVLFLIFLLCSMVDSTLWYRGFLYIFVPFLAVIISAKREKRWN
jgi:O-antigen ligase